MPGLVGFAAPGEDSEKGLARLKRMSSLLVHLPWHACDRLYTQSPVFATRVYLREQCQRGQPFEAKNVRVWVDGEIYRAEGREFMFAGAGLLAGLYASDPEFGFLGDIDGYFTAVIYDELARKIHLITDRYGFKHIFWTKLKEGLAWSSEVKALADISGSLYHIDEEAVAEFLELGFLTGKKTWFREVQLLDGGTVLTLDLATGMLNRKRYWDWGKIEPIGTIGDDEEITQELGRLFRESVSLRCGDGEGVGLLLSGGRDSRAILAAMSHCGNGIKTATFGMKDCLDWRIAREVCDRCGAVPCFLELTPENWLMPRLSGIWRTDGMLSLLDLHGIEYIERYPDLFKVCLSGFLGDATTGGSYLGDPLISETEKINNRGRRLITRGLRMLEDALIVRLPFFDNPFIELLMSLPTSYRQDSYIYRRMLLSEAPALFKDIPWQATGISIKWPPIVEKVFKQIWRGRRILYNRLGRLGIHPIDARGYPDYDRWIRREPAKTFFYKALTAPDALYVEYLPIGRVKDALERHFNGENHSMALGRYLTLEIWLRQLVEGKYMEDNPLYEL